MASPSPRKGLAPLPSSRLLEQVWAASSTRMHASSLYQVQARVTLRIGAVSNPTASTGCEVAAGVCHHAS